MNRWHWILACSLPMVAWASETPQLDLVKQSTEYGFQSVSMIVGAYERSDRPASEIAQILENGGLSKVTMPLVISPALAPHVTTHEPLGHCKWSWGCLLSRDGALGHAPACGLACTMRQWKRCSGIGGTVGSRRRKRSGWRWFCSSRRRASVLGGRWPARVTEP